MQYSLRRRKIKGGIKIQHRHEKRISGIISESWKLTAVLLEGSLCVMRDAAELPRWTKATLQTEVSHWMVEDMINEFGSIRVRWLTTGGAPTAAVDQVSVHLIVREEIGVRTPEEVNVRRIYNGSNEKAGDMIHCVEGYCWRTSVSKIVRTYIHPPS